MLRYTEISIVGNGKHPAEGDVDVGSWLSGLSCSNPSLPRSLFWAVTAQKTAARETIQIPTLILVFKLELKLLI